MNRMIEYLMSHKIASCGFTLLVLIAFTPLRSSLESHMLWHMLVQFPLIALAGGLLASALPESVKRRLMPYNRHGITGLILAASVLSFWMIPRALDEVIKVIWMDGLKFISLSMGVGAALSLSWQSAGFVVQGFFLANILPMMTVIGWLYMASPIRLCNTYLTSQQENTGLALIWLSIILAFIWLCVFFMSKQPSNTHG